MQGIPCRLKVVGVNGKPDSTLETFYFATFRRCKKLPDLVRKMTKLDVQCAGQQRYVELAQDALDKADASEIAAAEKALLEANEKLLKLTDERTDTICSFITEGLKGAGYPAEEAERLSEMIDPEFLPMLVMKSRIGAGYADFFVPGDQATSRA